MREYNIYQCGYCREKMLSEDEVRKHFIHIHNVEEKEIACNSRTINEVWV